MPLSGDSANNHAPATPARAVMATYSTDGDNAMKRLTWSIATALVLAMPVLCLPSIANAANGYVTGNIHLRAGPGWDFPLIADVRAGTQISVVGCTTGWQWCDVVVFRDRGWMPGNYIQSDYQGQRAPVLTYGARIGLPIVSFEISNYWDTYYRGRPFYRERGRWDRNPNWHGTPGYHGPPPRVVPLPHPIPDPHHYPIDYPPPYHHTNPPARVVPLPHPTPNPPPRVVPLPHPIPNPPPTKPARASPQNDQNDGH